MKDLPLFQGQPLSALQVRQFGSVPVSRWLCALCSRFLSFEFRFSEFGVCCGSFGLYGLLGGAARLFQWRIMGDCAFEKNSARVQVMDAHDSFLHALLPCQDPQQYTLMYEYLSRFPNAIGCNLIDHEGGVAQIQNGARCRIFVKLELGTKMKQIQAISQFSFVLYFNIHYTPKYKHAISHANRPAGISTPLTTGSI